MSHDQQRRPSRTQTNASDEEQVASAKEREKLRLQQERDDYASVLATAHGRRVLGWIMAHYFQLSYSQHANDTAFREGQRHLADLVRRKIMAYQPDALLRIQADELQALQQRQIDLDTIDRPS